VTSVSKLTSSKPRGRPPKPPKGARGEVRSDSIYPVTVLLKRLGIGRNSLVAMHRRGLPVHHLGRRCAVVYGKELVEFLVEEWRREAERR